MVELLSDIIDLQLGYVLLTPIILVEGPVVGIVGGALAAREYFNIWHFLWYFSVLEYVGDVVFFSLVRNIDSIKQPYIVKIVNRARYNVAHSSALSILRSDNKAWNIWCAKVIPIPHLMTSAMIVNALDHMSVRRFALLNALAQPVWSLIIVGGGYILSDRLPLTDHLWGVAELIAIGLFALFLYTLLSQPNSGVASQ